MKKLLFLISGMVLLLQISCEKAPDHRVRFVNLSTRIVSVTLDDTIRLDSIQINEKTAYIPIEEGLHKIGGDYNSTFTVEKGEGLIQWTCEIYENDTKLKLD